MPTLSITQTYADGDVLFESDLDNIIDDIETFLNVTKIDSANIQDGGIDGSTKLEDASVTASKIASNAITTAKLNDLAVTTAKINDLAVTTAKINDLAVTTAKINDLAVTPAKRSAANISSSSSSGATTITSGSATDVTNLSVSITTSGRPVMILLQNNYDGTNSGLLSNTSATNPGYIYVLRGASVISGWQIPTNRNGNIPIVFDQPAAGTYTYKIQAQSDGTGNIFAYYLTLVAMEI
jgi:hypothetical protein